MGTGVRQYKTGLVGLGVGRGDGNSRESNFQAIVMPPISESLKRNRKVPSGLLMSRSWACCLFTKPKMALGVWYVWCHGWVSRHHSQGPLPTCHPQGPAPHPSFQWGL